VRGVVDYTKTDQHNPTWWKHWRFLIRAMDDAEYGDLLQRAFEFQLALVSNPRISADDFTATQREAKEIFRDIEGALRPWLGRTKEDRKAEETKTFKQQWEELAGWSIDDKDAMDEWAQEIKQHTDAKQQERLKDEQEEMNRQSSFHAKIEAVRQKRLKQQGRK
jgi:hypothetical protein